MSKETFTIVIEETLARQVTVEAVDVDAAMKKVYEMYHDEAIVLDCSDLQEVNFIPPEE